MTAAIPEPDDLRASDADRHRIAERLHTAAAEGRLTLDELGDRLEVLYAARTYGELVPLTRDLPAPADDGSPVAGPGTLPSGPASSIALLGECNRRGEWVLPRNHSAVTLMGSVVLDLTHARPAAPEVTITAVAVLGSVEIVVPPGMDVEVGGTGVLGTFEDHAGGPHRDGPRVRITGLALLGSVEVKRRAPDEPPRERGMLEK